MFKKYFFQILSLFILNLFLVLFIVQERTALAQAKEIAVQFKMNFLKDSVTNFINEFSRNKNETAESYDDSVSDRENALRDYLHNIYGVQAVKQALAKVFSAQDPSDMWGYILLSNSDDEILEAMNMPADWDRSEKSLDNIFCAWRQIELPFARLYFGVTQKKLYNTILASVSSKVHNSHFVEETYYWINEVKNYKGGKDYAIRLIHPNPRSSEGMLLSTDMQDAVGDYPYERELEEINKKGESFNTYYFKKKDSDDFARKITYSKLYKPYNWIVCMGSYYDDIYDYVDTLRKVRGLTITQIAVPLIILLDLFFIFYIAFKIHSDRKNSRSPSEQDARDNLTYANTREFGQKELKRLFYTYKENFESPAIMFMDIDNFKTLNDTYGRETGDFVLVQIAGIFNEQSRSSDILIRWDGDRFAGIFWGMKKSDCWHYAQKLLETVSTRKIQYRDKTIQTTVSLGFSFFHEDDKSYAQAVERANKALKEAKAAGKNRARVE